MIDGAWIPCPKIKKPLTFTVLWADNGGWAPARIGNRVVEKEMNDEYPLASPGRMTQDPALNNRIVYHSRKSGSARLF